MSVEEAHKRQATNPMLKPRIEKVIVNMSVGKSGEPLEKAASVLEQLTRQKPCKRKAKKTIRDFGIRQGEPIACMVTLRKEKAKEFIKRALQAVENKVLKESFDQFGNFSFGIKEHIDIPGTKYLPELGIHGMDVSVTLSRPGQRVKRRHRTKSRVGIKHRMTPEEAINFVQDEFGIQVT
ncbi:MAG TPA: 50S ribosomal protein L5 [Candidatus Bathyarchaeia archaeon]|nr:50S ribosomal protein L5 [Candidatus Bathyarchaeia archaeon]